MTFHEQEYPDIEPYAGPPSVPWDRAISEEHARVRVTRARVRVRRPVERRDESETMPALAPETLPEVDDLGRLASAGIGGALVAYGLRRGSLGGAALALIGGDLLYRGFKGRSYLADALGLATGERPGEDEHGAPPDALEVRRTITILKSADELHRAWRDPHNLAQVMEFFAYITVKDERTTHWVARGPLGSPIEWDSAIVEERPGQYLRWESLEGAEVPNDGSVSFRPAPADRGTEMSLHFRFDPPGGPIGDFVFKTFDITVHALTGKALRRFKSLMETGEIPTTKGQPAARGDGRDE